MLKTESMDLAAPAIADRILTFFRNSTIPPYAVVENLSDSLSCAIEWQESNDNSTWTAVVGSSQTINPKQANGQIVNSNNVYLALFASGNVPLNVHVVRQHNALAQPI